MITRRLSIFGASLALVFLPGISPAQVGVANGKVCLIDTSAKGYGFSSYSGLWTSVSLEGPAESRLVGTYLGYLRTARMVYAYNSVNDHWFSTLTSGIPAGEDVEGATAIYWSSNTCYAMATLWTTWRSKRFGVGEHPLGGGSAGTFALVWTEHMAYAFHAASGQWLLRPLDGDCIGGVASDGLGLVWTTTSAYAFDPTPGSWIPLVVGEDPGGVSADGCGKVGLVWGGQEAQGYSAPLDHWYSLEGNLGFAGGCANGEVAILWNAASAYAFDATTGSWNMAILDTASETADPLLVPRGAFAVGPNPCDRDRLSMHLPGDTPWQVDIVDVKGALVRRLGAPAAAGGTTLDWNREDAQGHQVASGTYWIRAESGRHQVEARRIVLLP